MQGIMFTGDADASSQPDSEFVGASQAAMCEQNQSGIWSPTKETEQATGLEAVKDGIFGRILCVIGPCGVQKQHIRCIDFECGALIAVVIDPVTHVDSALDIDFRALVEMLCADFGLLAVDDDFVPCRALLALTVFGRPALIGGECEIRDRGPGVCLTQHGVLAEVADEHDFVE